MRLLTEPSFIEEFDTIVDEITDLYVRGQFEPDERKRLEQYFLRAAERRVKAKFASALIKHATATCDNKVVALPAPVKEPTLLERLFAFLSPQSIAFKFAMTSAVIILAVTIGYIGYRGASTPPNLAFIELTISNSDRGEGPQSKPLQIAPGTDAVQILLHVPAQYGPYQNYQVELVTRNFPDTSLKVAEQRSQTVTAIVPANLLTPGSYGVQLTGIKTDGKQERVTGTYYFTVE